MANPEAALVDLLLSLFSSSELRRFVRFGFGGLGRAIDMALPGRTASPADVAQSTVEQLDRHGLIGDKLWAQLKETRPYRSADIDRVEQIWAKRSEDASAATAAQPKAPAAQPARRTGPVKVFICYSQEDMAYVKDFKKAIAPLVMLEKISVFYDQDIQPGLAWETVLKRELDEAEIMVVLVTQNSLASEYCAKIEIPRAFERIQSDPNFRVVPVFVEDALWEATKLSSIQGVPSPKQPIEDWPNQGKAWKLTARAIADVASALRS